MLRRRALWVVLAALALLSVAAGAFAVQAFGGGSRPIQLTATETGSLAHLAAAQAAAQAWDADAGLVRVHATEGTPLGARVDPPFLYDTSPDPLVGNGRAVAWTYSFAAPSQPGRLLFVTVGGDGAVLYQRALADPSYGCCRAVHVVSDGSTATATSTSPTRPVLAAPTLDADEAFARVAERPEFVNFSADHPTFQVFLELMPGPEGNPAWGITYATATYFSASALVDAANGTVHHVSSWPSLAPPCCVEPPCCEPQPPGPCCAAPDHHGEHRVTLGPSRQSQEIRFPVESPLFAREARIVVQLDGVLPVTDEAVLQVYDEMYRPLARATGREMLEVVLTSFPGQGVYSAVLTLPLPARELTADVVVDVLYDAEAHAAPTAYAFAGAVPAWGSDAHLPLWFQDQAQPTRLTLAWTPALPADEVELVLLDPYGNEVEAVRATGGSEVSLDVPSGMECCLTALVRNAARAPLEVPFELTVEVAPHAGGVAYPTYGH